MKSYKYDRSFHNHMTSSKEFMEEVMDGFSLVDNVTFVPKGDEYQVFVDERLLGEIHENRLFIRPIPLALGYFKHP